VVLYRTLENSGSVEDSREQWFCRGLLRAVVLYRNLENSGCVEDS